MEPINAILLVITLLCIAVCVWLVVRAAKTDIRMAKKVAQAVQLISIWKNDEEGLLTRFAFYNYKDEPDVLYLSNLFVEEGSRNHGLGTRILKAAEMVAGTLGATSIRLKVMKNGSVRDWYYRRGFDLISDEDGYSWLEKRIGHITAEAPAELEKEHPVTVEVIRKAAKAYSESASNGHHFSELEGLFKAFRAGAVWQGKRVAAYIRECLEPEEEFDAKHEGYDTEANKNYRRGKIRGYRDILRDLESGGLDEYMDSIENKPEDKQEDDRLQNNRKKKIFYRTLFRTLLAFAKYYIIAAICTFCNELLFKNGTWEFTYPLALFTALAVDFLFHKYDQEEE